jgi:ferredoxin-NADP reductase
MEKKSVRIKKITDVTHNVRGFTLEKPPGYTYKPGQATSISINSEGWKERARPFTFTGRPSDKYLELIVKIYPGHNGVTAEMAKLKKGDELLLEEPWGAINYRGPGVFVAGGAGITPFISIFRNLAAEGNIEGNTLLFANNSSRDIILHDELSDLLGEDNFINILADEKTDKYHHGFINREFLEEKIPGSTELYYLCGPPPMMKAVEGHLKDMGVDSVQIVKEEF